MLTDLRVGQEAIQGWREEQGEFGLRAGELNITLASLSDCGVEVILQRAESYYGAEQAQVEARTGNQSGWVLRTVDCEVAYEALRARGVAFDRPPQVTPWGIEAEFIDTDGNRHTLIEPPGCRLLER